MDDRTIARFWQKAQRLEPEDCWAWTEHLDRDGYGQFHVNRHPVKAHRFAWEVTHGPIPEGQCVLHKCDNPKCVNPWHLWLGTQSDNNKDRARKGRNHDRWPFAGSDSHRAKLTQVQVDEVRQRYAAGGVSQTQLAHEYCVKPAAINKIVRGVRWVNGWQAAQNADINQRELPDWVKEEA